MSFLKNPISTGFFALGFFIFAGYAANQLWSDYRGASFAVAVILGGYLGLFLAVILQIDRRLGPLAASLFYEHGLVFPLVSVTAFGIAWTAFNLPPSPTWSYHLSLVGIIVGIQITSYKTANFVRSIPKRQGIQWDEVTCQVSWIGTQKMGAGKRSFLGSLLGLLLGPLLGSLLPVQRNVWTGSNDLNGVFEISLNPIHPNFNGTVTAIHLRRLKELGNPNPKHDKQIWTTKRPWLPIYPLVVMVVVDSNNIQINKDGEDLALAVRGSLASETGMTAEKTFRIGANVGGSNDTKLVPR